jgi:hypothetical protein
MKKLLEEIRRLQILVNSGMDCQKELDRKVYILREINRKRLLNCKWESMVRELSAR